MNLKMISAALALAVSAPFAASAALIDQEDIIFNNVSDLEFYDKIFCEFLLTDCDVVVNPISSGDTIEVTVKNNTGSALKIFAGLDATINPDDSFNPDAVFSFAGGADVPVNGSTISTLLGIGDDIILTVTLGDLVKSKGNVDIAFEAELAPVPVPAGILLMGTALAGFGVMRRRKKRA